MQIVELGYRLAQSYENSGCWLDGDMELGIVMDTVRPYLVKYTKVRVAFADLQILYACHRKQLGFLDEALDTFREVSKVYEQAGQIYRHGGSLKDMAIVSFLRKNYDEALDLCKSALQLFPLSAELTKEAWQFRLQVGWRGDSPIT
jgi:tetratricopeptide (TPR) repeat protein